MRTFTSFVSLRMQDVHISTAEQVHTLPSILPSLPPPFLPFFSLSYISSFHHTHTHHHISPSLLPSFSHQERRKQSARRVDRDLLRGHWAEGVDGTTADAEADKTALALVSALSACAATWWEYANLYK